MWRNHKGSLCARREQNGGHKPFCLMPSNWAWAWLVSKSIEIRTLDGVEHVTWCAQAILSDAINWPGNMACIGNRGKEERNWIGEPLEHFNAIFIQFPVTRYGVSYLAEYKYVPPTFLVQYRHLYWSRLGLKLTDLHFNSSDSWNSTEAINICDILRLRVLLSKLKQSAKWRKNLQKGVFGIVASSKVASAVNDGGEVDPDVVDDNDKRRGSQGTNIDTAGKCHDRGFMACDRHLPWRWHGVAHAIKIGPEFRGENKGRTLINLNKARFNLHN
ncbi:hypothetical protein B0H11DRAFT_1908775 [Mycena galericulata]|nr:hypothetical protein B0H11DRAFT_1908775 [Mycena galericulata]